MLLSDEHKAKSVTRDAAARYEQRIWRDRMRRRLDWHNRTTLKIQVSLYMWLARIRVQYIRDENNEFIRRTKAANLIFYFWHRTLQRRVLSLRFEATDDLASSQAQTACTNAAVSLLRRELERRRQKRNDAVALISKNYRRHWDRKHMN